MNMVNFFSDADATVDNTVKFSNIFKVAIFIQNSQSENGQAMEKMSQILGL